MNEHVVACFLVLFGLFAVGCAVDFPESFGWKFKKESNGRCYVHKYEISYAHALSKQESLQNFAPLASYEIDCHEGHTTVGMNVLWRQKQDENVLGICFFLPNDVQRVVCHYLEKEFGFSKFVDVQCNNKTLTRTDKLKYFYVGPVLRSVTEYDYVDYCVDNGCCRIDRDGNAADAKNAHSLFYQYEAYGSKYYSSDPAKYSSVYPFGSHVFRYGLENDVVHVTKLDGTAVGGVSLSNKYDFIHVQKHKDYDVDAKAVYSYTGFKYTKIGRKCFVLAENADTKEGRLMAAPCYENIIAEGYNIEWDVVKQLSYLRMCLVVMHPQLGPRLVCHRYRNGIQQSGDVDFYFKTCRAHFYESKPIAVVIRALTNEHARFKGIVVETTSYSCIVDVAKDSKTPETLRFRDDGPLNGYDAVADKSFAFGAAATNNNSLGVFAAGAHIFVRNSAEKWTVNGIDKPFTKNWSYPFVVEETIALDLVF